jgi:hypothetical protein
MLVQPFQIAINANLMGKNIIAHNANLVIQISVEDAHFAHLYAQHHKKQR